MSDECCEGAASAGAALAEKHRSVLWIVLAINLLLFVVEAAAGLHSRSTALLGDSLDMLGDALIYAASLVVLGRSLRSQAWVAVGKGLLMGVLGIGVLSDALLRLTTQAPPPSAVVGTIGAVALGEMRCASLCSIAIEATT